MKRLLIGLIAAGFILGVSGLAMAESSTTQTVTYEVVEINEVLVSGSPGLTVNTVTTVGSDPDPATTTATYSITTNGSNKKITGAINTAMPTGTTLEINVAAPTVGASAGNVTLSTTAANLVTGITKQKGIDLGITYKLSATVAAGVVESTVVTVTLTIASG